MHAFTNEGVCAAVAAEVVVSEEAVVVVPDFLIKLAASPDDGARCERSGLLVVVGGVVRTGPRSPASASAHPP